MRRRFRLLRSVRTRLAFWHTFVLAFVLVIFTLFTWAFLQRLTQERVDQSLAEAVRSFHQAVITEARGQRTPDEAAQDAAREFRFSGRRVLVYGSHHSLVAVSDSASDDLTRAISAIDRADDSPMHPLFASLTPGRSTYATIQDGNDLIRSYATSVKVADQDFTIVALQVGQIERTVLANFTRAVLIAIPLALVLAGVGGYILARGSFAPVVDMGRRASSIDSESLDARLAIRNTGDEMDELAASFNEMLTRLERSFVQQRQFMADASHELRTPIASLRAEASVALSRSRSASEYEASLVGIRNEARRLSEVVDDLFTLARLDADEGILHKRELFLEELLTDAVSRLRPLAEDRGVTLNFRPTVEARCSGDPLLLDRVITNLIDNAIKYGKRDGSVAVKLDTDGTCHMVSVVDDGAGIPAEAQSHVFDRFFRADAARTRSAASGGAGLGLSIAWKIAHAHGGKLELKSSGPEGTSFLLTIPAVTPA
jgi:heavy metal sensor kinase